MNNISKIPAGLSKTIVSDWRVCIPSNLDRDVYIARSKASNTISVLNSNAEFLHRVMVGKLTMDLIDFPEDKESLGSMVVLGYNKSYARYYVLDVFNLIDEGNLTEEGQMSLRQSIGDKSASVFIDGKNGRLNLSSVNGGITIKVSHDEGDGLLNLSVNGQTVISSSKFIDIKSFEKISNSFLNKDGETTSNITLTDKSVNIDADEAITFNKGDEAMVLGNTLAELLKDLFDLLINTKVATSIGTQPFLNVAQYTSLKGKIDDILSKLSFLK